MIRLGLILAAAVASCAAMTRADPTTQPTSQPSAADVRVLTYNIRNSGANDGANGWRFRRASLIRAVRSLDSDVIGMQEVLADQADFIREQLPDYGFVGTGRDDGKRAGEFAPILFRQSRYELIGSGQSWLSDSPDVAGSMGWDAACTRVMTWATLRDRSTGRAILVTNTHWDHVGVRARIESAKLMRRLIETLSRPVEAHEPLPVIVTGDFNCTESDEPYRVLLGDGAAALTDTYRSVHPQRQRDEASFNGFDGHREGERIDWILVSHEWSALDASIDRRTNPEGRFPSDHYAVTARVALK